jgi:drug/metabolite transporter (DMT)-like permease
VIAFYSYFYLLKNIGPEKASYSMLLFPVISVMNSSIYEGFEWSRYTVIGFILVGLGNVIMQTSVKLMKKLLSDFKFKFKQKTKRSTLNQATG